MNMWMKWRAVQTRLRARHGRTDDGASLVEYALLLALIAIVCIVAIAFLGETTSTRYSNFGSHIEGAGQ